MILDEYVTLKWCKRSKRYYVEHGYVFTKIGDSFNASVKDLMRSCKCNVNMKCDYCGEVIKRTYYDVMRCRDLSVIKKDACRKCAYKKQKESNLAKYGVENVFQIPEIKQMTEHNNILKYGSKSPSSNEEIKKRVRDTNIKRYGENYGIKFTKNALEQRSVMDINDVREFVNNHTDCTLLSNSYNGLDDEITFKCKCGNEFTSRYKYFLYYNKRHCDECGKEISRKKNSLTMDEVKRFVTEHNCELLDSEYTNENTKMNFRCKCGNNFSTTFYIFKSIGKRHCDKCGKNLFIEKHSGKNNSMWKGGITPLNKKIRTSGEYKQWRKEVFERDGYKCRCCGNDKKIQAHHIKNFSDYPELRLDIGNGITLCKKCHSTTVLGSFHYIYGTKDNTLEQLQEYITMKKLPALKGLVGILKLIAS